MGQPGMSAMNSNDRKWWNMIENGLRVGGWIVYVLLFSIRNVSLKVPMIFQCFCSIVFAKCGWTSCLTPPPDSARASSRSEYLIHHWSSRSYCGGGTFRIKQLLHLALKCFEIGSRYPIWTIWFGFCGRYCEWHFPLGSDEATKSCCMRKDSWMHHEDPWGTVGSSCNQRLHLIQKP